MTTTAFYLPWDSAKKLSKFYLLLFLFFVRCGIAFWALRMITLPRIRISKVQSPKADVQIQSCADNLTCREFSEAEAGCLVRLLLERDDVVYWYLIQ